MNAASLDGVYVLPALLRTFDRPEDPRHLMAGWSSWIVLAYTIAWLVRHSRVVHLLTCTRVYRQCTDHKTVKAVLGAVGACHPRCTWTFGAQVVGGRKVPVCVASLRPRAFVMWTRTQYVGTHTPSVDTEFTVMTLAGSPPLVPDPAAVDSAAAGSDDDNSVSVLEPCSNKVDDVCLDVSHEIAVAAGVPPAVRALVSRTADQMAAEYRRTAGDAKVFVLLGVPGSGKSTTARQLARLLGATLYARYNPTRPGQCLLSTVRSWSSRDAPLVVVMEEFDVALSKVVRGGVAESDALLRDATDKSSWNSLLDAVKQKKHVVLVMTTNCSRGELLQEVCLGDASLLRAGRVDEFIGFAPTTLDSAVIAEAEDAIVAAPAPAPAPAPAHSSPTRCRARRTARHRLS